MCPQLTDGDGHQLEYLRALVSFSVLYQEGFTKEPLDLLGARRQTT
jgi:hypothetical protein